MNTAVVVLHLLDALIAITGAIPQIATLQAKLRQFKEEGRDPTREEWQALFGGIQTDTDRLDAADKRLNP